MGRKEILKMNEVGFFSHPLVWTALVTAAFVFVVAIWRRATEERRRREQGEFFGGDLLQLDIGTMGFWLRHPEVDDTVAPEVIECRYNPKRGYFEVRLRNSFTREVIHPEGEQEFWYPAYCFVLRSEGSEGEKNV